jgi:uncharacterized protein YukE
MSFEGMDVDQLQGLAKQIDSDAQALDSLVTTLTGVVGTLTLLWNGPVAVTFEQDWQSKNRPALLGAYNTLRDLHTHLVSNISQQTSASAAEGGWTAERVVGDFENVLALEGLVGVALSGTKILDGTPIGSVFGGMDQISLGIDAYHTQEEEFHVGEDVGQGHYVAAANDFTNGVADGLDTTGDIVGDDDPLLGVAFHLAGVDLKLADQVANLDWKDTPNPLSASQFDQYYVPELKSMGTGAFWEQAGKTIWGDM